MEIEVKGLQSEYSFYRYLNNNNVKEHVTVYLKNECFVSLKQQVFFKALSHNQYAKNDNDKKNKLLKCESIKSMVIQKKIIGKASKKAKSIVKF